MYPYHCNIITGFFRGRAIFIVLLTVLFLFSSAPTFADGMVIEIDPYDDRFEYADEDNQSAFISYDNGLQSLILSIGIDDQSDSGLVWIFPVPSDPDRIVLDVLKSLPILAGKGLTGEAISSLRDIRYLIQATQIYTIPFMSMASKGGHTFSDSQSVFENPVNFGMEPDVKVHEHIEKEGITSEIITARTADGLYKYLSGKGLNVDVGAIPVLDHYIGNEFSFVVSWITETGVIFSTEGSLQNIYDNHAQRGVFVTFPTDEIYYPLLPTSVYGSKIVPAVIRIIGHVTPRVFSEIRNYVTTEYYVGGYLHSAEGLVNFLYEPGDDIKYTKIEINAPSKLLTEDLWISSRAPFRTYISSFVVNHPFFIGIILLILSSVITGIIAGWIVFRDHRKKTILSALLGLSNCLTIMGVVIATFCIRTKAIPEDAKELLGEINKRGYIRKRILPAILFAYAIFFLLFGIFFMPGFRGYWEYEGPVEILFLFILPTVAFMLALDNMRVKIEDRGLFNELKEKPDTTGFFFPIGVEKINFLWLYSVSFLFISWLLVKLIEFIV